MIKLGTNILSQKVQRNLGRATTDLSTTSERLASGMRINKASDDAAGLAIAASLNADTRIFTQGIRNLNDGLSAGNIAEGAMEQLGNIIIRIEELSTQSANGTYSDTQRGSLQKEASALVAEWNRIVESTSFNGRDLLTGNSTRTVLQGGKGSEGTLAVQIGEAQLESGLEGYGGKGTTRVSTDSAGNQVTGAGSYVTAISADGRYVAFYTSVSNLVAGDTNGQLDSFVKDTVTGITTRISTDSSGNQAMGGSSSVFGISADGRYVAFNSTASNLVAGDINGKIDVFIKDTITGVTTRVSTTSQGVQAKEDVTGTAISADGRYVTFNADDSSDLGVGGGNNRNDGYVKDTVTGLLSVVSTDSAGNLGNGNSSVEAISADGRYVSFLSFASNLVTGDTNGQRDSFIKDTLTGITTRITTDSAGNQGNGASFVEAISSDGRYVAFDSSANNLVAGDTNGLWDSFIKDTVTGVTTRISTDSAGNQATGADSDVSAISADGRYVAFYSSASNLVAGDTNGQRDSFIKDTVTGITTRISTDSAGNQAIGGSSTVTAISADGRIAAFYSSATNLVAGDTNVQADSFLRDLTKTGVQTLSGVVLSNKVSAKITLDLVQKYRAELLDYRAKIGASTSRIGTFINTLQSSTINYKAASSRITDADIAEESSKSIAARITQQVATSLLGQANQAPQIALSLLRGA
jgi:flagellin-like hook-associated protein FlgL